MNALQFFGQFPFSHARRSLCTTKSKLVSCMIGYTCRHCLNSLRANTNPDFACLRLHRRARSSRRTSLQRVRTTGRLERIRARVRRSEARPSLPKVQSGAGAHSKSGTTHSDGRTGQRRGGICSYAHPSLNSPGIRLESVSQLFRCHYRSGRLRGSRRFFSVGSTTT